MHPRITALQKNVATYDRIISGKLIQFIDGFPFDTGYALPSVDPKDGWDYANANANVYRLGPTVLPFDLADPTGY